MRQENETSERSDPLATQVGGSHYQQGGIQPIEFIQSQRLGFIEGSVVKYVTRWRNKNGLEDLKKARHYLDILIALEADAEPTDANGSYASPPAGQAPSIGQVTFIYPEGKQPPVTVDIRTPRKVDITAR